MKKRLLCVLLVLTFIMLLIAGCGNTSSEPATEASSAEPKTSSVETAAEPVVESTVPEVLETPAEEDSAAEAEVEEPESPAVPEVIISYPLDEPGEVLTYWTTMPGNQTDILPNGYNDHFLKEDVEKALGVSLDITSVAQVAMFDNTAYELMIASGDWPDLLSVDSYTGGASQAYSDGVIIELTEEMLAEDAPDYYNLLMQQTPANIRATQVDGTWYSMYSITVGDGGSSNRGMVLRTDWLNELNMDIPTTIGDLTEVLKAFKDTYNPKYTYFIEADADMAYICAPFNTYTMGYYNSGNLPLYHQGDEVKVSWVEDEYRDFLEWFREMYDYGIFEPSFYITASDQAGDRYSNLIKGDIGIYEDSPTSISDWRQYALEGETVEVSFFANPLDDEGKNTWGEESEVIGGRGAMSISTNCKDPKLALNVLNYFFTDEGAILANYGVEGYSFNYGDDGKIEYTELLTNSSYQLSMRALHGMYCWELFPAVSYADKLYPMYNEEVLEAIEIMSTDNITAEHYYPRAISLTADESSAIITNVTDITTYCQEQLLKFMVGDIELSDANWNDFVAQVNSLGLQDCLEVYQNAYDEYISGNR